jgi:hypothetical protein
MHGGRSTGPRTPEGLQRLRAARTIHGRHDAETRTRTYQTGSMLRRGCVLLDAMRCFDHLPPELAVRLLQEPPEFAVPPYPAAILTAAQDRALRQERPRPLHRGGRPSPPSAPLAPRAELQQNHAPQPRPTGPTTAAIPAQAPFAKSATSPLHRSCPGRHRSNAPTSGCCRHPPSRRAAAAAGRHQLRPPRPLPIHGPARARPRRRPSGACRAAKLAWPASVAGGARPVHTVRPRTTLPRKHPMHLASNAITPARITARQPGARPMPQLGGHGGAEPATVRKAA